MLNEARTWGRGQKYLWKKYQIMVNNIWFKIIAGKFYKENPEFYTIFARQKCPIT